MENEKLIEFSNNHLGYEIYILFSALELFAKEPRVATDPRKLCVSSLSLEGVIMHSRCLYEFFYHRKSNNPQRVDDALAIHYFEIPGTWESLRPDLSDYFDEFYSRASKELAHLTYTRMERTDLTRSWDLLALINNLYSVLKLFIENADSDRLHPQLKGDLEFWRQRLSREIPPLKNLGLGKEITPAPE